MEPFRAESFCFRANQYINVTDVATNKKDGVRSLLVVVIFYQQSQLLL
jgi:hypothetical protein